MVNRGAARSEGRLRHPRSLALGRAAPGSPRSVTPKLCHQSSNSAAPARRVPLRRSTALLRESAFSAMLEGTLTGHSRTSTPGHERTQNIAGTRAEAVAAFFDEHDRRTRRRFLDEFGYDLGTDKPEGNSAWDWAPLPARAASRGPAAAKAGVCETTSPGKAAPRVAPASPPRPNRLRLRPKRLYMDRPSLCPAATALRSPASLR